MPQPGVMKFHNDFVSRWLSIIVYNINDTFYKLAMH